MSTPTPIHIRILIRTLTRRLPTDRVLEISQIMPVSFLSINGRLSINNSARAPLISEPPVGAEAGMPIPLLQGMNINQMFGNALGMGGMGMPGMAGGEVVYFHLFSRVMWMFDAI